MPVSGSATRAAPPTPVAGAASDAAGDAEAAVGGVAVAALSVYPIKSCAGVALDRAEVGPRGIRHDREWLIADAASGAMLTQRELPRMALIRPTVVGDGVHLEGPGMEPLPVPTRRAAEGQAREVRVWKDVCRAVDQGAAASAWLGAFLGTDVRLLRMADDHVRRLNPRYARSDRDQVGFADGYPLLLISEESLAELNGRLPVPVPMDRFRPNVVVAGGAPFGEDGWRRVRIGDLGFAVAKACARCAVTTVDQAAGAFAGKEPLRTLARYRRGPEGVRFGQLLIQEGEGAIAVGDRVRGDAPV